MEQQKIDKAVLLVQQGDTESFGIIYDSYIERIYRFVYYKTHHKPTAEDITADIFTKALAKIKSYDPEKGSLNGWLYQIARNTVIDHYRRVKQTENIDDVWDLASNTDIQRDAEIEIMAENLKQHLSMLTAKQRDVVILRVWEGLSYCEIAEAINESEASCKMAYSRAIKALRDTMGISLFVLFLTNSL